MSDTHAFRRVRFADATGYPREIVGCPEAFILQLKSLINEIGQAVLDATEDDQTFAELYRESLYFRQNCLRAIAFVLPFPYADKYGSQGDRIHHHHKWLEEILTVNMIAEFVCPFTREDKVQSSLIEQICFPVNQARLERAIKQVSWEERLAATVSALMGSGLAQGFDDAWAIARSHTPAEIDLMIAQRVKSLDPKAGEKEALEQMALEVQAKTEETGTNPLLDFSAFPLAAIPIDFSTVEP